MTEILQSINNLIEKKSASINDWFHSQYKRNKPFFYNSVDIRYSGDKISPVDTNIFPAGFNNLSNKAKEKARNEILNLVQQEYPSAQKIVIIAEFHTRNLFYLENLKTIENFFLELGKDVKCAYLDLSSENQILNLKTSSEKEITLYPLQKKGETVYVNQDFIPDLIIVNNDLTKGKPEILNHISQPIIPPVEMGWYKRKKYNNCLAYNHIASNFAKEFNLDPFLITTELNFCEDVHFNERKGIECIAINVEKTLNRIQKKYDEFQIKTDPYVYLKANRGTYGMGIMIVHNAEEVLALNKKNRNKMNIIKNNTLNAEILIQEGVPTIDTYKSAPAEPFIYIINGQPVGSILRINKTRNHLSNLNSSGVEFIEIDSNDIYKAKIPAYCLISKLASLASTQEEKFD